MDLSDLATKLGVDESTLNDAFDKLKDSRPRHDQSDETTGTEREATLAKALAEELGLDEAKVTAALSELRVEREAERAASDEKVLEQAVTDGKLTQSEADAVQKAISAGIVSVRGGHGPRR